MQEMDKPRDSIAPLAAMLLAVVIVSFLTGIYSAHNNVFPYPQIQDALLTADRLFSSGGDQEKLLIGKRIGATELAAAEAGNRRWRTLDESAPRFPVIANGGLNQFSEHCPGQGCVAVAFNERGEVDEIWPYQPDRIYAADITGDEFPHEFIRFNPSANVYPLSVQRYQNGDVLVNFQAAGDAIFPFGMGISRISPSGEPRWTRFDFSHHWSTLTAEGLALVPSLKVGDGDVKVSFATKNSTLDCDTDHPQLDTIQIVDGDGSVIEEIELMPIVGQSNWGGLLLETTDACDPLHLNYIDVVGDDAEGGLVPGDLVLSFRNLSRFAIFDPVKKQIRQIVGGGFIQQHSVRHLSGSRFLIFDNRGGDASGPPSRVVEFDIATGSERRVFPNSNTPEEYAQVFSNRAGHLDISPDRERVLASFTHAGRAFEIEISSGRLIAVYDHLHDISSLEQVPEGERAFANLYSIYGMSYRRD